MVACGDKIALGNRSGRVARPARDTNADGDYDDGTDAVIATYCYDGDYRRIRKQLPGDANYDYYYNEGLGLRSLGGAGWQVLEERTSTGQGTATAVAETPRYQYVWDIRYIDSLVLRDEDIDGDGDWGDFVNEGGPGARRLYYLTDVNFNVTAVVDAPGWSSEVSERYVYDPYGKPTIYNSTWTSTVSWANSLKDEILYCGYRYDPESGLYHVRMRAYGPLTGRWMSRDLEGYISGPSLYEYCMGSPTSLTDPLGDDPAPPTAYPTWRRDPSLMEHLKRHHPEGYHTLMDEQPPAFLDENAKPVDEIRKLWARPPAERNLSEVGSKLIALDGRADKWFLKLAPPRLEDGPMVPLRANIETLITDVKAVGKYMSPAILEDINARTRNLDPQLTRLTNDWLATNELGHAAVFWHEVGVRDGWWHPAVGPGFHTRRWTKSLHLKYAGEYPNLNQSLSYGKGKGKQCRCSTDGEIADCLRASPSMFRMPRLTKVGGAKYLDYGLTVNRNCITDSWLAMKGCCLDFRGGDRPWLLDLLEDVARARATKDDWERYKRTGRITFSGPIDPYGI